MNIFDKNAKGKKHIWMTIENGVNLLLVFFFFYKIVIFSL